jgi:hypothetical protein
VAKERPAFAGPPIRALRSRIVDKHETRPANGESEDVVGTHRRNIRVLDQGHEVPGVYPSSVWYPPPQPGRERLPLFTTARGEINDPVQVVSHQGTDRHAHIIHPAIVPPAPVNSTLLPRKLAPVANDTPGNHET